MKTFIFFQFIYLSFLYSSVEGPCKKIFNLGAQKPNKEEIIYFDDKVSLIMYPDRTVLLSLGDLAYQMKNCNDSMPHQMKALYRAANMAGNRPFVRFYLRVTQQELESLRSEISKPTNTYGFQTCFLVAIDKLLSSTNMNIPAPCQKYPSLMAIGLGIDRVVKTGNGRVKKIEFVGDFTEVLKDKFPKAAKLLLFSAVTTTGTYYFVVPILSEE